MIFVDANVPMYLVGAAHRHKASSRRLLERAVELKDGATLRVDFP